MDFNRGMVYVYLIILLIQTFVNTRSIKFSDIERLESDVESDLDDVIQILQEVRHIKHQMERSRRHSGDGNQNLDSDRSVRRRRTHPLNRRILLIRRCRFERRRGNWPDFCANCKVCGPNQGQGTSVIQSPQE